MDGFGSNWMDRIRGAYHNSSLMRSGFVTVFGIVLLLAVSLGLWYEHIHGNFHRVRVVEYVPDKVTATRPGGLDLIRLTHVPVGASMNPEFLSVVLAPGLGMQVLQATINLPGHGDVPILLSMGNDANGNPTDASVGAPFLVQVLDRSGSRWTAPVTILTGQADHISSNVMPDGGGADAQFGSTQKSNGSGIETTISATLGGHALDLVVTAKNQSEQPHAVTVSWQPRFLLPAGGATLIPPRVEDASGASNPPAMVLGTRDMKTAYIRLKRSYLSNGPEVQLRNDRDGYVVHLTAISQSIRSLRVESRKGDTSALLAFSTGGGEDSEDAPTVLKPGESLQLSVRLEVTPVSHDLR